MNWEQTVKCWVELAEPDTLRTPSSVRMPRMAEDRAIPDRVELASDLESWSEIESVGMLIMTDVAADAVGVGVMEEEVDSLN